MSALSSRAPQRVARVLLRLPAELHRALAQSAADAGLSVNELCVRRLIAPTDALALSPARSLVVSRACAVFGDRLLGVLSIGSWARGQAAAASDIDVLIVVDPRTALTRELYRVWDRDPISFEGRAIDPHFTHPLQAGAAPTSVWCEAAVDAVVWFDRDGSIALRLGDVRREIAEGRMVRTFAHGQPYWKGAA